MAQTLYTGERLDITMVIVPSLLEIMFARSAWVRLLPEEEVLHLSSVCSVLQLQRPLATSEVVSVWLHVL